MRGVRREGGFPFTPYSIYTPISANYRAISGNFMAAAPCRRISLKALVPSSESWFSA